MKQLYRFKQVIFLLFVALIVLACNGVGVLATATPFPTNTPMPVNTATPRPTSTPRPTQTEIPPTQAPAAIGVPVKYGSLEITVLDVKNLDSVHFGDVSGGWETFYKPLPGKFLIDIGVLVRNLDPGAPVLMDWMNVYIVEESGNAWYPGWGSMKTVSADKKVDPFTIGLNSTPIDGENAIEFDNDTYMRLIFSVDADPENRVLFAIDRSPVIGFYVAK
jgi:hypothetical protein